MKGDLCTKERSDVEGQEFNDVQEAREHSIPLVAEVANSEQYQQHQQEEEEEEATQNETLPMAKPERVRIQSRFAPWHHDYDATGTLSHLADKIAGFYEQTPVEQVRAKVLAYVME